MKFYTYDPRIAGQDAFDGPFATGDTFRRVDTGEPTMCQGVSVPAWGLYPAQEDPLECGPYTKPRRVEKAFTGEVGEASGLVVETAYCDPIELEDLWALRVADLNAYAADVDRQGIEVSSLSAGARAVKTDDRTVRFYLNLHNTSTSIPDATAVRMKDLWDRWFACTKADAGAIITQIAIFHDAPLTSTTEAHDDELERLYLAGDRAGLEAYDVTSGGWPPAPVAPAAESTGRR